MGFHIIYTFILQQRVPKVVADESSLAIFQRTSHLQWIWAALQDE